jgi:hypothetical protein
MMKTDCRDDNTSALIAILHDEPLLRSQGKQ